MLCVKLEGKNGVLVWLVRFNHPSVQSSRRTGGGRSVGKATIKEKERHT